MWLLLIVKIEDITCPHVDTKLEHEKIKFVSTSGHVIFCLLHKHTNHDVFDDFPKISEDFSKLFKWPDKRFRTFSEHFPNIFRTFSEDYRRLPKTTEEDPKMFRSYIKKFKCS